MNKDDEINKLLVRNKFLRMENRKGEKLPKNAHFLHFLPLNS